MSRKGPSFCPCIFVIRDVELLPSTTLVRFHDRKKNQFPHPVLNGLCEPWRGGAQSSWRKVIWFIYAVLHVLALTCCVTSPITVNRHVKSFFKFSAKLVVMFCLTWRRLVNHQPPPAPFPKHHNRFRPDMTVDIADTGSFPTFLAKTDEQV